MSLIAGPALAKGGYDIPTGAPASPLFGAQPFTQKLLMFEEFSRHPLPNGPCANCAPPPIPSDCNTRAGGPALDAFLAQPLSPAPTFAANTRSREQAWLTFLSGCLGDTVRRTPIEGRPPGEFFAHQRWDEFYPQIYTQSAQTGARANGGLRTPFQRHGWSLGEFGPGGLYYRADGNAGIEVRLHPNMPIQHQNSVWTFDGTLPPKLLQARYGEPVLFRHYNALPVRPSANNGFGANTISTHHHNGHNPAESDGFGAAYFFPGQYYDYVWPMVLAGNDTINTAAESDWSGRPEDGRGISRIRGDWHETMSTHWFHDHMVDFTAQNVYKGNAAMMNLYSSIDPGVEDYECNYEDDAHPNMCFPSGTALGWGNRDYDVNLLIADKAWDRNGQLFFNIFNLDGFMGDRMTVNWQYKPYMEVRARRYRFRLLNGSVSRYFKIAVINAGTGQRIPFHMIANDGNIMEHAVRFPNAQSQDLPTQSIAERYDIIIDFSQFAPGTRIQFVNLLEHKDGKGPNDYIPLNDVLRRRYEGDPGVGAFLEFRVVPYSGVDHSMNPAQYEEGGREMISTQHFRDAITTNARRRLFEFGRSGGTDEQPWTIKIDGGDGLAADLHRVSAIVRPGAWEIWTFRNGGNGWAHPIHAHFEEGYLLSRDGRPPPIWERGARKDVFRVGPEVDSSREVRVLVRFREFLGTYMEHCHNTQHEDHAMLLRFDARDTGQTIAIPTPVPTWEGVYYEPSFSLGPRV